MTGQGYDVVIIGGGVTGTALLYTLAKFTDLRRVLLLEKYAKVATVNSKATNNSQTITAETSKPIIPWRRHSRCGDRPRCWFTMPVNCRRRCGIK